MAVSVQQQSPQQQVTPPNNETLHRLAVDAAGYLGIETGDPLPIDEIVEQGVANGYDEPDIRSLIREQYDAAQTIAVPPQGNIFGEMWRVDEADIESKVGEVEDRTIQRFTRWCEGKRQSRKTEYEDGTYQHPVEHAYSYKGEKDKFARFKDVERYFLNEYSTITTILLTYTRTRSEDESIVEHANSFYPEYPITRKRGDCIKTAGYWDEYAGVSLLAPKDVAPNPCAETTHAHDMLVLPSFVSSKCFDPLREEGVDVSIRYHRSDKVEAPPSVNRLDLEQERGATTSLSQEVGANLPVLSAIKSFREKANNGVADLAECEAKLDATHCPDYVTRWCAEMSCGKDGDPDENGIRRWRPLGEFKNIADSMKEEHSEERGYEDNNAKTNQCLLEGIGAPEDGDTEPKRIDSCNSASNKTPEEDTHTNTSDTNESQFDFPEIADSDSVSDLITESQFEFTEGEGGGSVSETDTESQFEFTEGEDGGSVSETGTESQFDFIRLDEENNTNDSSSQFTFTAE